MLTNVKHIEPMQVLMVGQVPPPTGGVTEQVRLLAGSLPEHVSLTHLSPGRDDTCRGVQRIWNSIRLATRVIVRCVRNPPDIAHLHTSSHLGFHEKAMLARLLSLFGVKVVLHLHGGGFAEFYECSRVRWWIRRAFERAEVVLALSAGWKTCLERIAPRARVEVFRNSIDLDAFQTEICRRAGAPRRIVFLGALVRAKGVYRIPAIARHFDPSEALFEVIGDGPEAAGLAAAIRDLGVGDRVNLRGALHGAAKIERLQRAEVFLLPSDVEGQPVSILEAMAAGAAVVSTEVGGVPEMLADGRGVACAPDDVPGQVAAIRRLLRDEAWRQQMVGKAWDYVREHHNLARQVCRLVGIYQGLVGGTSVAMLEESTERCARGAR